MKLREQFEKLEEFNVDECVKIAENFAIGFAEWVDKIGLSPRDSVDYHLYLSHTITELLEIYKKPL